MIMTISAETILRLLPLAAGGTWIFFHLAKCIYNLFFHPLSHIPGPWLAAATHPPEFYHDVVRGGRYTTQIQQMHEKYGRNPLDRVVSLALLTCIFVCVQVPLSVSIRMNSTAMTTASLMKSMPVGPENVISPFTRSPGVKRKLRPLYTSKRKLMTN